MFRFQLHIQPADGEMATNWMIPVVTHSLHADAGPATISLIYHGSIGRWILQALWFRRILPRPLDV